MKKLIIRVGGLVPTYFTENSFTCHISEAKEFTDIESAKKFASTYKGNKGVSIRDKETESFVSWVNW